MKIIATKNAPEAVGPYVQGIDTGDLVFYSGQIGLTPEGDFVGGSTLNQLSQILKNLEGVLTASGLTKKNVVKATVFITDMSEFADINKVYGKFFADHKPARSCIGVASLPLGASIEIEILAKRNLE